MSTRVGIIGGGQLGRMLALAGEPMGMRFVVLDPTPGVSAGQVCEQIVADYDDEIALAKLAESCDVVTYEFENVPDHAARFLEGHATVHPPSGALQVAQDRVEEKRLFAALEIPTPDSMPISTEGDLAAGLEKLGAPAVVKTRRLGYDGKGQAVLRSAEDVAVAWQHVHESPSILESFLEFDREVSIIGARGRDGATAFYPLVENHHRDGILRLSLAPAPSTPPELQALAEGYLSRLLERLDYVGVLALELFQIGGRLLANEMAPRVHNSGHWTIEGAETSQFEQHLRAICGLPLGSTATRGHSAMLNVIGAHVDAAEMLARPGVHLHDYGKEPREGRKLGHLTIRDDDPEQVRDLVADLRPRVGFADEC